MPCSSSITATDADTSDGPVRTTTGLDHPVTVTAARAGDEVVASFNLSDGLWWKLESVLYKPPNVFFTANDGEESWRIVTATGPHLHILQPSSALGYSPAFIPLPIRNLEFSISGEGPRSPFSRFPIADDCGSPRK